MRTSASDISGEWQFAATNLDDASFARVTLKIEGDKLTGKLNELKLDGIVKGPELKFTGKRPNGHHFGDFIRKALDEKLVVGYFEKPRETSSDFMESFFRQSSPLPKKLEGTGE